MERFDGVSTKWSETLIAYFLCCGFPPCVAERCMTRPELGGLVLYVQIGLRALSYAGEKQLVTDAKDGCAHK